MTRIAIMKLSGFVFCATLMVVCINHSQALAQDWQATAGPYGGNVWTVAKTPEGTLLAGAENGVIYRSIDLGRTWEERASFFGGVRCFAATATHGIFVGGDRGYVYRSTDDGISWTAPVSGISTLGVYSIAADDSGYAFAGTADGFFVSTNHGLSWTRETTIQNNVASTLIYPGDSVFALSYAGSYFSSNHGATWANRSTTGGLCLTRNIDGVLYAGKSFGVVRSNDGGRTWVTVHNGLPAATVYAIEHDSLGNLFAAPYGDGIYRLPYQGSSWQKVGLGSNTAWSFVCIPPAQVFSATQRGAVFYSNDNGNSWSQRNAGVAGVSVWCFSNSTANIIYAGAYLDGVFRSTDQGSTWTSIGLVGTRIWAVEGLGDSLVFAVTDAGLYKTTNAGGTWTSNRSAAGAYNSLAVNTSGALFVNTGSGVARSTDGGTSWSDLPGVVRRSVYCDRTGRLFAFNSSGLQYSTDNGETWTERPFAVSMINIRCLAAFGNDLLLGRSGFGLARSTNLGLSWEEFGFPNSYIQSTVITSERKLFTGIHFGGVHLYESSTTGWRHISQGLPTQDVRSLTLNTVGQLLVALEGRKTYRTTNPVTAVHDDEPSQPTEFILFQNYPNPFNPTTRIEYSLPKTSHVSLKVFDVMGREVATLVDEVQNAGFKTVEFDAAGLSSGVYFYRLTAGGFVEIRKLMLIR